jgi:hypothetical protein
LTPPYVEYADSPAVAAGKIAISRPNLGDNLPWAVFDLSFQCIRLLPCIADQAAEIEAGG